MKIFPDWFFNQSDWQEKTLGEVCEIQDGTHGSFKRTDEGYYLLSAKNVGDGNLIISDDESKISYEDYKKIISNGFPAIGDILISCVGVIGRCCILKEKNLAFQRSVSFIRAKKICTEFLLYVIQSHFVQKQLQLMTNKSVQGGIYLNSLRKVKIKIPPLAEQKKIAEYFTHLDNAINAQETKLQSWRDVKKAMLQKIFSQQYFFTQDNGDKFPAWQEKTLGENFCVRMCKRIYKNETSKFGDIPFYKIGTLGKIADSFISKNLYEDYRKKYNFPEIGDTLISCSGTVGNCVIYDGKPAYFQDSNIVWLEQKTDLKIDKKYLYFFLSQIKWTNLSASTIARIYSDDLLKKYLKIPCLEEQKKIAEYFSSLDRIIDAENKMLENLRLMKKGLLQKLFV